MRTSNRRALRGAALAAVLAGVLVACGSSGPSTPPASTPVPTPAITPDPHLVEPATADDVFNAIRVGKLPLSVNNATNGMEGAPVVKRINADIGNWPLVISQYRSSEILRTARKWDGSKPATQGHAPYTFVGLNIVIEFGPTTGKLAPPDPVRVEQAERLVALVDPLLWPLEQQSVEPLATRTAVRASAEASPVPPKKTPKP
jgi:hypothetical protein